MTQPAAEQQLAPRLTADLRLQPRQLERTFWIDKLPRNKAYDAWVIAFYLIMLICITPSWVSKLGWQRYVVAYMPSWLMIFVWLAALRDASLYRDHRNAIVVFGRIVMGLIGGQTANDMKDTIYTVMVFENAEVTLLYKFVLLANTFELPIEAGALQLPFLLQVVLLIFRASCMLFTGCTKELIKFGNSSKYLTAADGITNSWAAIIQSVLPLAVPACSRLAGRSTAIFLSLTVLHFTTVFVVLYMVYISLWVDVRLWLRGKMTCIQDQRREGGSSSSSQISSSSSTAAAAGGGGGAAAAADVVDIGGVWVSQEQLRVPYTSPAAALLLSSSATGRAVAVCLHAILLGIVCQLSLMLAQLFVYQVFPRVISAAALEEFYPLTPTPDHS